MTHTTTAPDDPDIIDTTALQVYDHSEVISKADPTAVMQAAEQIVAMVARKCVGPKFISKIQGKDYPKVEWWTTVGAVLGLFPQEEYCKQIIDPKHDCLAYEALVTVRRHGDVVARASAICSTAEKRWATAETYAVRSMAITRATGKAYRLGLSFLAVMAGLEATPAEEMPQSTPPQQNSRSAPPAAPVASPGAPAPAAPLPKQPPPGQLQHGVPIYLDGNTWNVKEGDGPKGHWTLTSFQDTDGHLYATFDTKLASIAGEAVEAGTALLIHWLPSTKYADQRDVKDLAHAPLTAGAAEPPPAEPAGDELQDTATIQSVDQSVRQVQGQDTTCWAILTDQGRYGTFDKAVADEAQRLAGNEAVIFYTQDTRGKLAIRIEEIAF